MKVNKFGLGGKLVKQPCRRFLCHHTCLRNRSSPSFSSPGLFIIICSQHFSNCVSPCWKPLKPQMESFSLVWCRGKMQAGEPGGCLKTPEWHWAGLLQPSVPVPGVSTQQEAQRAPEHSWCVLHMSQSLWLRAGMLCLSLSVLCHVDTVPSCPLTPVAEV